MKNLIIILISILLCAVTAASDVAEYIQERYGEYNLRHRDLEATVMCLDLGKQRGMHNMKVTKKKYYKKLIDSSNKAEGGKCFGPVKKLKANLKHNHKFCKEWNGKLVLINAPEGTRKWLTKEIGATLGDCGGNQDDEVKIFE